MFDADDRKLIAQWAGVWLFALTALASSFIILAIVAGIAYSAFKFTGGL